MRRPIHASAIFRLSGRVAGKGEGGGRLALKEATDECMCAIKSNQIKSNQIKPETNCAKLRRCDDCSYDAV